MLKDYAKDERFRFITGISLLMLLGVTTVSPVFPALAEAMSLSGPEVGWLVTGFALPGVFLAPVGGILADRLGRKVVLIPSLALFAAAGFACAFAPNYHTLLLLRGVQGCGAAAMGTMVRTLLGDFYDGSRLADAIGVNAGLQAAGAAILPALGGALGMIGWRWPFALPVLAVPVVLKAISLLPAHQTKPDETLSEYLKNTLGVLRSPKIAGLLGTVCASFLMTSGCVMTFFPILLGTRLGAAPWEIGLIVALTAALTALSASRLSSLSERFSEERLIRAALLGYAAASAMLPLASSLWGVVLPVLIFGLARGLNMPAVSTLLTRLAPKENRAAVMAANSTAFRIGQSLGPILLGTIYAAGGLSAVYWAGAALSLLIFAATFKIVRP